MTAGSIDKRGRRLNVVLWIAQVFLALFFLPAGIVHGLLPIEQTVKSAPWAADLPVGLVKFIGAAEIAGAIGVLLPAALRIRPGLTPLSAGGLTGIMLLAIPFHISRGESRLIGMHAVVAAIGGLVAWGRFRGARIEPRTPIRPLT